MKKALTWKERSQTLMNDYLKKVKATQGSLLVLSVYGDPILKAGKSTSVDLTTLGSLAASVSAAAEGLGELLRVKGHPIQMGSGKTQFWFERLGQQWLIVGLKCPLNEKALKTLMAPLAKGLGQSAKGSEALDGMNVGSLDSKLNERMR